MISPRLNLLGLAALLTLLLVAWTAWRDLREPIAEVVAPRQGSRVPPGAQPLPAGDTGSAPGRSLDRDPLIEATVDPFKVVSFAPPPPKPVIAVAPPAPAPPKPVAPAFPYKYFGRVVGTDGKAQTYLSRGDALVAVRERDVLDQMYRIDTITETQIGVTYLPLDEKLTLATPSASR